MASLNQVSLIGHLGKDPELKKFKDQEACKFPLATSESFMKDGTKYEKTEWHRVTVWGKMAPNCAKYLKTGSKVFVEGKLQTSKYNKDGVDHYSTEIIAFKVLFLDSKTKEGSSNANVPVHQDQIPEPPEEVDFSQIPF